MDKKENQVSGMQKVSADDLEKVTGGETRRVVHKEICPICGEEITVPLSVHLRGHALVPCPVCGHLMPAGRNSKCFNCGYISSEADDELKVEDTGKAKSVTSTIFLDSKC